MTVRDLRDVLSHCQNDDRVNIMCSRDGWETSQIAAFRDEESNDMGFTNVYIMW